MFPQETKSTNEGQLKEVSGGYTFFWKGNGLSQSRTNGVDFTMKNHIVAQLKSLPNGINDRSKVLRLPLGKTEYASFMSAYAPPMTNPDGVKDKFYCDLEGVLCSVPTSDKLAIIVLEGRFHASVGSEL